MPSDLSSCLFWQATQFFYYGRAAAKASSIMSVTKPKKDGDGSGVGRRWHEGGGGGCSETAQLELSPQGGSV